MGLTLKKVARLKKGKPGRYFDSNGLYLEVRGLSNSSYIGRFQLHGKEYWMGVGSTRDFSLEEARQRWRRERQLLADKINPLEARRAERARQAAAAARNKTFAIVAAEYYDQHAAGWSPSHRSDFLASLKAHAYPTLGNLPIAAVDEPLVLAVLRAIWSTKNVTARRIQQRLAAILDFASAAGYRSGSNPARWKGHLEHLLAAPERLTKVEHHAALPYAEVPCFMQELRGVPGVAARALEFTILTAARTNEVRGAVWDEIDLDAQVWIIPGARMKAGVEHSVPLSRQALALLRALPREGRFVFISSKKAGAAIGDSTILRVLKELRSGVTVHGFRSAFRTWVEERTSYAPVLAEHALAHVVGSGVERSYRRTTLFEQRARLMAAWSDFIDRPVAALAVTPLRGTR